MAQDHNQNRNQRRSGGHRREREQFELPPFNAEWIRIGITDDTITYTKKVGEILAKKLRREQSLSTSQIRNVYGEMKRIQLKGFENEKTAFLLLKPKLAYAKSRGKEGMKLFEPVLQKAFNAVENKEQYQNLMDFMEAILAYHKSFGGK